MIHMSCVVSRGFVDPEEPGKTQLQWECDNRAAVPPKFFWRNQFLDPDGHPLPISRDELFFRGRLKNSEGGIQAKRGVRSGRGEDRGGTQRVARWARTKKRGGIIGSRSFFRSHDFHQ
jgi:hypothetical protein